MVIEEDNDHDDEGGMDKFGETRSGGENTMRKVRW
jgi:hypothetical protein